LQLDGPVHNLRGRVVQQCGHQTQLDEAGHSIQPPSQHQNWGIMPELSSFPITQRWPASHPDRVQLYAAPTPNGVKVSIMLEEIGLAYEPHLIDIYSNIQAWLGRGLARPAVQRGLHIPARPA
jgi:hypothetical protein